MLRSSPRPSFPFPAAAMVIAVAAGVSPAAAEAVDGAALFERHCASCHRASAIPRVLAIDNMRALPPETIVGALTDGAMREQGAELRPAERRAIAEFITGRHVAATDGASLEAAAGGSVEDGDCASASATEWPGLDGGPQWNGWGAAVTNARFQPAAHARLAAADVPRLRLRWAFGYPNSASAQTQPTVVGGRLFAASERGVVYALDARTGCTHWSFEAQTGVRSAMTVGRLPDGRHAVFFGDFNANVYALDAASGAEIWRRDVDTHVAAPHHRSAGAARRTAVRSGLVSRRVAGGRPGVPLLHVPRQPRHAPRGDRRGRLAGVHHPGSTGTARAQPGRLLPDGAGGRRRLVGPDHRPGPRSSSMPPPGTPTPNRPPRPATRSSPSTWPPAPSAGRTS